MSSCLVIQQRNNIFIASDTAISSQIEGKAIRVGNFAEKLFRKDRHIVFCSGNMEVAKKCRSYIKQMELIDIEKIRGFVSSFYVGNMFEIFIADTSGGCVKTYQLSSYNDFSPIERVIQDDSTEIYAMGYNVASMLNSFESYLSSTDVISSFKNTFSDNICTEVGGNLDVIYYHNGTIHQQSYDLNDGVKCLISDVDSKYCDFVIADSLIGKVILGQQLYIGNEENTFVIRPNGLSIYDPNAIQEERVFLGIEGNKAVLRLHSADGNNKLVLSEQGIYQVFPVQARDSFDRYNSFKVPFYLPTSLQRLDEARLILNIEKFRAYSKAMSTQPETTETSTSASGGNYSQTKTSKGGGRYAETKTSKSGGRYVASETSGNGGYAQVTAGTMIDVGNTVLTQPPARAYQNFNEASYKQHIHEILPTQFNHRHNITLPNHTHSIGFTVPEHTHDVDINIPEHTHDVDINIPDHTHEISLVIPAHSHDIEYGIYEFPTLPTVRILLDGVVIADNVTTDQNIDLSNKFTFLGGTHSLEIQSLTKTGNVEGLGRASLDLFVSGFVSY